MSETWVASHCALCGNKLGWSAHINSALRMACTRCVTEHAPSAAVVVLWILHATHVLPDGTVISRADASTRWLYNSLATHDRAAIDQILRGQVALEIPDD